MVRDRRFARRTVCTLTVFAAAFVFYLLTAAYVPYPGDSSSFLASLVFPWQYAAPRGDLIGSLMLHTLAQAVPPSLLMSAVSLLAAICGAVAVTAVFRIVYFTVQLSSIDMEGVRADEIPRTTGDIAFCADMTGLAAALAALVSVPLWALATRPLPATLPVAGIALLWALAAELRYRQACLARRLSAAIGIGEIILFTATSFLAFVLLFSDVSLLAPVFLALVIVFRPLLLPSMLFRLRTLPCLVIGLVLAFLVSLGIAALWIDAFAGDASGSLLAFLAGRMSEGVAALRQMLFQPSEAVGLALMALAAALMFGCFPVAYCSFGRPLIGQLVTVALPVASALGWPGVFWETLQQPTALAAMAVLLTVAVVGSLVGSWCRCWLDVHMHWRPAAAYRIGGLIALLPLALCASVNAYTGWRTGSGFPVRQAFRDGWKAYEAAVGPNSKIWLSDTSRTSDAFILYRYVTGNPIAVAPLRLLLGRRFDAFGDSGLVSRLRDDALLSELTAIGEASVRMYLQDGAAYAGYLADADHSERAAEALVGLARHLEDTDYGLTPVGRMSVRKAREWAARCYASRARSVSSADALRLLRLAAALNPANRAYPLGVEAAALESGCAVTADERLAALRIREAEPFLKAPTWWQMEQFDAAEDVVHTAAFDAARRLREIRTGARDAAIAALIAMYRADPASLSPYERAVVLLELPETEAAEILLNQTAAEDFDILLYLAAYPLSEASCELARRYPGILAQDEAIARCYDPSNVRHMSLTRMTDMASAYFAQKASYARALLYVSLCLKSGDIDRARRFVSGFLLEERLPRTAYMAEHLRLLVLRHLADTPDKGRAVVEGWLRSQPQQSALWSYLLQSVPMNEKDRRRAVIGCLSVFPAHPQASALEAAHIRAIHGDAAAERYLNAVRTASAFGKDL